VAVAQWAANETEQAGNSFEQGTTRYPGNAMFHLQYAEFLLDLAEAGDRSVEPRAGEHLQACLKLEPSNPEAHYYLGRLLLQQEKYEDAVAELKSLRILALRGQRSTTPSAVRTRSWSSGGSCKREREVSILKKAGRVRRFHLDSIWQAGWVVVRPSWRSSPEVFCLPLCCWRLRCLAAPPLTRSRSRPQVIH